MAMDRNYFTRRTGARSRKRERERLFDVDGVRNRYTLEHDRAATKTRVGENCAFGWTLGVCGVRQRKGGTMEPKIVERRGHEYLRPKPYFIYKIGPVLGRGVAKSAPVKGEKEGRNRSQMIGLARPEIGPGPFLDIHNQHQCQENVGKAIANLLKWDHYPQYQSTRSPDH